MGRWLRQPRVPLDRAWLDGLAPSSLGVRREPFHGGCAGADDEMCLSSKTAAVLPRSSGTRATRCVS